LNAVSKLQPVFIIASALLGVLLGKTSAGLERLAGNFIEIFLITMLFFTFLGVEINEITKSFANFRFSVTALAINFLWTPLFAFVLSKIFFGGQIDLQIGFIMLMVTPCTDWYLIFTGLASGNVPLASSVLPMNLILQIILLPVYLFVFMGRSASFVSGLIVQSVVLTLVLPLTLAGLAKIIASKTGNKKHLLRLLEKNDTIQTVLLCLAVLSMFASQSSLLFSNLIVLIKLLLPLLIFFVLNFLVALSAGKKLKFSFTDTVPLIFTTSARNSPVALAIAAVTFPSRPLIALVLVAGPLIELPVLALDAALLRKIAPRQNIFSGKEKHP
jgi:ACR3 family arsenite efflux pump ArsB